jgi:hypothetical protein
MQMPAEVKLARCLALKRHDGPLAYDATILPD